MTILLDKMVMMMKMNDPNHFHDDSFNDDSEVVGKICESEVEHHQLETLKCH